MKRCLPSWIYGWLERLNETLFSKKENFFSHLYMEYVIDADYEQAKRDFAKRDF